MKPEDINDLQELVELLKQHQIAEFSFDRGDLKISLKFSQPAAPPASVADLARLIASAPAAAAPHVSVPVHQSPAAPVQTSPAVPAVEEELHIVKSPIVGTFYGSPSPGSAQFVSPGDHVQKGQVICIVEAMKLMNEIEADVAGEIVKCLVSNGQPIEYGQPLFSIRQG